MCYSHVRFKLLGNKENNISYIIFSEVDLALFTNIFWIIQRLIILELSEYPNLLLKIFLSCNRKNRFFLKQSQNISKLSKCTLQ